MAKKIMLLGSGELGKEFVIAAQRLGQTVVACDSYAGAPAMQVADACEVFPMLDGDALAAAVARHRPDVIVPEIEAIRTERLYDFEREGIQVVPSARAVNFTMNRKAIRDLAARELGLKTAHYFYATSLAELEEAAARIGFPCVVKPLMSSSGKGQSLVRTPDELEHAWEYGCSGSRGDIRELIIEEFIPFDSEITLLTVTQQNGPTLFCPPIGHVQKGGDYRESFQPAPISPEHLAEAQAMAAKVTQAASIRIQTIDIQLHASLVDFGQGFQAADEKVVVVLHLRKKLFFLAELLPFVHFLIQTLPQVIHQSFVGIDLRAGFLAATFYCFFQPALHLSHFFLQLQNLLIQFCFSGRIPFCDMLLYLLVDHPEFRIDPCVLPVFFMVALDGVQHFHEALLDRRLVYKMGRALCISFANINRMPGNIRVCFSHKWPIVGR